MLNANSNMQRARAPPPALNPETPALVQPWKDFVSRGWVQEITLKFSPLGNEIKMKVSEEVCNDKHNTYLPPGQVKDLIQKAGLWSPRGPRSNQAKAPERPKKSLIAEDFEDDDEKLKTRALAVANALGSTVARGRVGSLQLMKEGKSTFPEWWAAATAEEKIKILTDKKRRDEIPKAKYARINTVLSNCPFRGPVPTPSEE